MPAALRPRECPFIGIAHQHNPRCDELVSLLQAEGAIAVLEDINELETVSMRERNASSATPKRRRSPAPCDRRHGPVRHLHRHPLLRSHAGAVHQARRLRSDASRPMAISTSTSITPSKTSASCWASCSPRRSATATASIAPATSSCRWTRRWPWSRSISAAVPRWSTRIW